MQKIKTSILVSVFLVSLVLPLIFLRNVFSIKADYPITPPVTPPVTPPTVTPTITPTAKPTPTPTPTPTPKIVTAPVITTNSLPAGTMKRWYGAIINATDTDGDYLRMVVNGIPANLTASCTANLGRADCTISGYPKRQGKYLVTATAYDYDGSQTSKTFVLMITNK